MFLLANLPRVVLPAVRSARYASQFTDASSALRSAAFSISTRAQTPMDQKPRASGQWEETRPPRGTNSERGAWQQRPRRSYRELRSSGMKQDPKTNFHGDIVLFEGQEPPEGYAFFLRDRFLIRHCRILAKESNQKIYMFIPANKDKQGYYVPADILEQVRSRTEELSATDRRRWWQNLEDHYPNIPEEDKAALDKLCYSTFLARTAKSPQFYYNHTIRLYVLDRYTDVKLRPPFAEDEEVIGKAHAKADKILLEWMSGSSKPPGGEPVAEE